MLDLPAINGEPLSLALLRLRRLWAFVAKGRMPADRIIKAVDIAGDGIFGMVARLVAGAPDEFGFDRLEHRFHHGSRCRIAGSWPGGSIVTPLTSGKGGEERAIYSNIQGATCSSQKVGGELAGYQPVRRRKELAANHCWT